MKALREPEVRAPSKPRSATGHGFRTGLVDADLRSAESRLIEVE
jgi:hypothetical protein